MHSWLCHRQDQPPGVWLACCCTKASWSPLDEANTKKVLALSEMRVQNASCVGWKLTPFYRFLILLKVDVTVHQKKSAEASNQMIIFFFIFVKNLTKSQDGGHLPSLFPAPTAVYLATELLGQENGSRNGGLARALSGCGPQSAVFWAVCNLPCPVWQPKTDGF